MSSRIPHQTRNELDENSKPTLENRFEAAVTLVQALRESGSPQKLFYAGDVALAALTKDSLKPLVHNYSANLQHWAQAKGDVMERALLDRDGLGVETYVAGQTLYGALETGLEVKVEGHELAEAEAKEYNLARVYKDSRPASGIFEAQGNTFSWHPVDNEEHTEGMPVPFVDLDATYNSPFHMLFGDAKNQPINPRTRFLSNPKRFFPHVTVQNWDKQTIEHHFYIFSSPLLILTTIAEIFHPDRRQSDHQRTGVDQHWWALKILHDDQGRSQHTTHHDGDHCATIYKSVNWDEVQRLRAELQKTKEDGVTIGRLAKTEVELLRKTGHLSTAAGQELKARAEGSWTACLNVLSSFLYDVGEHHDPKWSGIKPEWRFHNGGPLGPMYKDVAGANNPNTGTPRPLKVTRDGRGHPRSRHQHTAPTADKIQRLSKENERKGMASM